MQLYVLVGTIPVAAGVVSVFDDYNFGVWLVEEKLVYEGEAHGSGACDQVVALQLDLGREGAKVEGSSEHN